MDKITTTNGYHRAVEKVKARRARQGIGVRELARMIGKSHTLVSLVLHRKMTSRPAVERMLVALDRRRDAVVGRGRRAS